MALTHGVSCRFPADPNSSSPPNFRADARPPRGDAQGNFRVIGDVESKFLPTQNVDVYWVYCWLEEFEDLEGQDMIEAKNKCVPGGVNLIGLLKKTSDWASSDVSKHIRTCSNISQSACFRELQYPSWPLLSPSRNNATWPTTMITGGVPKGNPESPKVWFTMTFQIVCPSMVKTPLYLVSMIYPWFIHHFEI